MSSGVSIAPSFSVTVPSSAVLGDAAEQVDRGAVGVLDRDRPLEAVLDVGRGQVVAVGELLALLERAGEGLRVVVLARLGGVADDLGRVGRDGHEGLVEVVLQRGGAEVVGPGRVERGDGVGRAEDPGLADATSCAAAASVAVVTSSPHAARLTASGACSDEREELLPLHVWSPQMLRQPRCSRIGLVAEHTPGSRRRLGKIPSRKCLDPATIRARRR